MAVIPYSDFDPEVVPLCKKLNSLPGLLTVSSCCGHGENPFSILFQVDKGEQKGLFILSRSVNRRYWEFGDRWIIYLDVLDTFYQKRLPIIYCLESIDKGEESYKQSISLVENIDYHLHHRNFIEGFEVNLIDNK